jgi:hypothetical protein
MKQVKIQIPDSEYPNFMKLLSSIEYITVEEEDIVIPEEHKNIVRERIKASESDPSRLMDWDKAKQQLQFKNA